MRLANAFRKVSFLDLTAGFGSDWQTHGGMDALESHQTPMGSHHKIEVDDEESFVVGHGCSFPKWTKQAELTKGGKRAGSGRKPLDNEPTVITTIRLTAKQKKKLEELGGASWVRKQLDLF